MKDINQYMELQDVPTGELQDPQLEKTDLNESIKIGTELRRKDVKDLFASKRFKVKLKCYVTKNNVIWVVTDILDRIMFSVSGGQQTKRGYLKNSQRVATKIYYDIVSNLQKLKVEYVYLQIKNGFGHKKHNSTYKIVCRLLENFKQDNFQIYPHILNKTTCKRSTIRLKGGRRGRR